TPANSSSAGSPLTERLAIAASAAIPFTPKGSRLIETRVRAPSPPGPSLPGGIPEDRPAAGWRRRDAEHTMCGSLARTERKDSKMNGVPTFLLVHGSWHIGDCWSAVAAHLREAGFPVATPTLAGHGVGCDRDVTHDDYVRSVIAELDRLPGEIVLVGHSFGG